MTPARRRTLEAVLYLAGLVGMILLVRTTAGEANASRLLQSRSSVALAVVGAAIAQYAAGRNWTTLLEASDDGARYAKRALYGAQLAKYVPAGGVVQVASQVALAKRADVTIERALLATLLAAGQVIIAGSCLGLIAVVAADELGPMRWFAILILASVALSERTVLRAGLALAHRWISRIPPPSDLPAVRSLRTALGWAFVNFFALAAAFSALLAPLEPALSPLRTGSAFALAWVVGFLVLPLPGGLGIREAVLIGLLPEADLGALLIASLGVRLVSLVAEAVAFAISRRPIAGPDPSSRAADEGAR